MLSQSSKLDSVVLSQSSKLDSVVLSQSPKLGSVAVPQRVLLPRIPRELTRYGYPMRHGWGLTQTMTERWSFLHPVKKTLTKRESRKLA